MSLKQAAEELLKIADDIERDAAEVTEFVCNKCNHTATLAAINAKRQEIGKLAGATKISEVTVNDKVQCPACDGVMSYRETEASKPYYFDPDKEAADEDAEHSEETETPEEEAAESVETQKKEREVGKHASAIDYDHLDQYIR